MKTIKILLIKDMMINLVVKHLLKKHLPYDISYEIAECDETAIEKCKEFRPDIIIITNGGFTLYTGMETAKQLKRNLYVGHIPMIMLSSLNKDEDKRYASMVGVCEYLTYPIDENKLVAAVNRIIEKIQTAYIEKPIKARRLYEELADEKYASRPFKKSKLGENMELVEEVICQYWKPRYIIDHDAQTAFEFMNGSESLMTVSRGDILWETLEGMKGYDRAVSLNAHYPTRVGEYKDGVSAVSWQINPDGMYFRDEDGFGITSDNEEELYGYIDRQGRVVSSFRPFTDIRQLDEMRREAIENTNKDDEKRTV